MSEFRRDPDEPVWTLDGLRTPTMVVADREYERELEAERLERHAPASCECW